MRRSDAFVCLNSRLRKDSFDQSLQVPDSGLPCLIDALKETTDSPILVISPRPELSSRLCSQLEEWFGTHDGIAHFPEESGLPIEFYTPDPVTTRERLTGVYTLAKGGIVVSSISAAARFTISSVDSAQAKISLSVGELHPINSIISVLIRSGYKNGFSADSPGSFSKKGGILDIFPTFAHRPIRVEFFDDEIESIRAVDVVTQLSVENLDSATIDPAAEILPQWTDSTHVLSKTASLNLKSLKPEVAERILEHLHRLMDGEDFEGKLFYSGFFQSSTIIDHLPENGLLILLRPMEIRENALTNDIRIRTLLARKISRRELPEGFPLSHLNWSSISTKLNGAKRKISVSPWGSDIEMSHSGGINLPFSKSPFRSESMTESIQRVVDIADKGERVIIASLHGLRIQEMLQERGVEAKLLERIDTVPAPGEVALNIASLREGFSLDSQDGRLTILTNSEIMGVFKDRPSKPVKIRQAPRLEDLEPGTYVVHVEHGIARFSGVKVMEHDGGEYLVLQYAEDDKLYVPVEQIDRVQAYLGGSNGTHPRLTRLGTQEWKKSKARARRAAETLAGELLAIYAQREVVKSDPYDVDTPWQEQMEAAFPYEETPAQYSVVEEIKSELESDKPMDRLVCGDVGYGKTEVALRATFKSVMNGQQVALLVPTTVLARQHFETFTERLSPFPVNIGLLSRFTTPKETKRILEETAAGKTDIVIGTHRLLQRDVHFKNLGLLVIDEEHKFGVTHKERIRNARANLNVLTMSATPIPRTLHMSLSGVRDMSSIDTPPEERLPIKTYVSENSDELIREAIIRELDRNGQVFVLHNRVRDIDYFAAKIRRLAPEASIAIAHGQMGSDDLESVMNAFAQKEFDVLVCTTIIESGIDLPNVNTLIVDRADTFGLAQLYQLRGRVGRGAARAYAYLTVQKGQRLTEQAEKRLNTILAANELGAGFQIASSDLEIRGIGNILGAEQSGHISAIGFSLYNRLLSDAVAEIQGKPCHAISRLLGSTFQANLAADARIPQSYIEDLAQRMTIYRRLAQAENESGVKAIRQELRDRFGIIPQNVDSLLKQTNIRILAENAGASLINADETVAKIALKHPVGGAKRALQKALPKGVRVGSSVIYVQIDREDPRWLDKLVSSLKQVIKFRENSLKALESIETSS